MEDTRERLIRYLDDAWALEKAHVAALQDMAHDAKDPQLKSLFEEHKAVTWQQEERLEARIRALGGEPSGVKGFTNTMMMKISEVMHGAHDDFDKATLDLMKAYGIENMEMAMYWSLECFANAIGDLETAQLAHQHLEEEKEAAKKVWEAIPRISKIPAEARVLVTA